MLKPSRFKVRKNFDYTKYMNPDLPVGHPIKYPRLVYVHGGYDHEGEHYILADYIDRSGADTNKNYARLADFEFELSDIDDDCTVEGIEEGEITTVDDEPPPRTEENQNVEQNPKNPSASIKNIKKEKDKPSIKREPSEDQRKKKHSKHAKKGHTSSDVSSLDAAVSEMDISDDRYEKKKKERRIKQEPRYDYGSDSDSRSSHRLVRYTPSPSPERYPLDIKIKMEPLDQSQHLFGSYHCDVCNISMTSELNFNAHIVGKRHRKNVKAKNIPEAVAQSIPATVISEDQTKYPKPRPGVIRKKVLKKSAIQHIIEHEVKKPCPGLNFVTEIQCIEGVQYYCSMCDSVCSSSSIIPHLTGYKHQLNSVKQFKPGVYADINFEPKYKIEGKILNILSGIQSKEGMGRMAVEVEELNPKADIPYERSQPSTSRDYRDMPSTSRDTSLSSASFPERYDKATVPDQTASDFYCKICDSHMNAQIMWEAHIRGKRHLTNLKKMPGDRPSKNKTIAVGKRAQLFTMIKHECPNEPFVGLDEIRETWIGENNTCNYQCFLCGSCHIECDIIDHLVSLKHRTKYLDHIDYPGREVISGMSDSAAIPLIREMCEDVVKERGTGKPDVHISKSSVYR